MSTSKASRASVILIRRDALRPAWVLLTLYRYYILFYGVMSSFYAIWDTIDDLVRRHVHAEPADSEQVFRKINPCCARLHVRRCTEIAGLSPAVHGHPASADARLRAGLSRRLAVLLHPVRQALGCQTNCDGSANRFRPCADCTSDSSSPR